MKHRPEIFISATPGELDAYRGVVRQVLKQIGAQPVELTDYGIDYGPLQGVLNQLIGRCEAVIHLAGYRYGPEPAERTLGAPRRSFGHYEVDVAHRLRKPVFAFLTTPETPVPVLPNEPAELRQIQREQRDALEKGEQPSHPFSSGEQLATLIRALRLTLMARRKYARLPHPPLREQFVGRQQLMARVREDLARSGVVVLHPPEGVESGGTGRTTLAVELAWSLYEEDIFPFVFMLPAGSRAELEVALASLARSDALALLPDDVAAHQARLQAVLRWFRAEEQRGRWLVILDGVDSAATWTHLRAFLPEWGEGPILVTSRLRQWPDVRSHIVGAFSADQTREFVLARSGSAQTQTRNELAAIDRLGDGMGRVPLALALAAGYLHETRKSALQLLSENLSGPSDSPFLRLPPTAVEIVERSFSSLDSVAQAFLRQLTCFAPQPAAIPLALFELRGDWAELRDRIGALEQRALISRDESGRTISVHRAIREMLIERIGGQDYTAALGAASAMLDAALRRETTLGGVVREQLVPHCRHLLKQLKGHPLEVHAVKLTETYAQWLQDSGRPAQAEVYFRRALRLEENRVGKEHPELVGRLRDLVAVLRMRGRLREAEKQARRALAVVEKSFGPEHPEVIGDLYLVAGCLRAQNQLAEATQMLRRTLAVEEKCMGPAHPRTSIAVQRLAGVLEAAREMPEAEQLYRRALAIDEKSFGPNHPRISVSLGNLAGLLAQTGRAREALEMARRSLEIDARTYGTEHAEYTAGQKQLACVLEEAGEIEEAAALRRAIRERDRDALGQEHHETAVDGVSLGCLLLARGNAREAETLAEDAVRTFTKEARQTRTTPPALRSATKLLQAALEERGEVTNEEIEKRLARIDRETSGRLRKRLSLATFIDRCAAEESGDPTRFAPWRRKY